MTVLPPAARRADRILCSNTEGRRHHPRGQRGRPERCRGSSTSVGRAIPNPFRLRQGNNQRIRCACWQQYRQALHIHYRQGRHHSLEVCWQHRRPPFTANCVAGIEGYQRLADSTFQKQLLLSRTRRHSGFLGRSFRSVFAPFKQLCELPKAVY